MPDAILSHRSVTKGELTLLEDVIVSGSAVTQVDFGTFNIGKGEEVMWVVAIVNSTGGGVYYTLYANANYTGTNYYAQNMYASNTTIGANRDNFLNYTSASANSKTLSQGKIKLSNNGYILVMNDITRDYGGSGTYIYTEYGTSTFTATSITSFRLVASSANGIGIGSRFQLYKVGG